jgi:hypothetical protein
LAYTNNTSRTDAAALIPEEVSNEMLGKATEQSAVLQMFRRVPVGRAQVRFPVLSALPVAYFFGDVDALYAKVETDGFDVTGWVGAVSAKSKLRTARDSQGRKLDVGRVSGAVDTLDGYPIAYPMRGLWPTASSSPRLFGGDWSQFVIGVRQDITMKILTEAVIQDNTGAIVYNLAQQDMTAVRLTFRIGWQVANTINNDQPTESARYPVSALLIP